MNRAESGWTDHSSFIFLGHLMQSVSVLAKKLGTCRVSSKLTPLLELAHFLKGSLASSPAS